MTVFEKMVLDRLDQFEKLLKAVLPPPVYTLPGNENDYTRAKRESLEAREKSRAKKALKGWDYSNV